MVSSPRWRLKLATIHDGICSDLARLQEDPAEASGDFFSTLDFLQDAIAEVLHSMGVEIIEVAAGTRYDSEVHRRTKLVDVDDPALHRTVAPSRRSAHFYRFNLPEPPLVVSKAAVAVYRHTGN